MFRYALAPASCIINSVVIYVSLNGGAGVQIDRGFGVQVGGQDCLLSVTYISEVSKRSGMSSMSGTTNDEKRGKWYREGYYCLLPYRRSKRPYDPIIAASVRQGEMTTSKVPPMSFGRSATTGGTLTL